MTDLQRNDDAASAEIIGAQQVRGRAPEPAMYAYQSAGIAERKGNVPIWLWAVVVSLLIWGAYYLATYWNAPVVA